MLLAAVSYHAAATPLMELYAGGSGSPTVTGPAPAAVDSTPACSLPMTLWLEDFSLPDGATSDTGVTAWAGSSNYSHAVFSVYGNAFKVNNISVNGVGTWTSAPVGITGRSDLRVSVDVRSAGGLENDTTAHADYISLYYKLDGGPEVLFARQLGKINNGSTVYTTLQGSVTGTGAALRIIIRAKATATDEYYYFDNVKVTTLNRDIDAPASVTATPSNQLTCAQQTVTLTGNSSTPDVQYNWSGPNGFSSDSKVTTASVAGPYTLTVTNPVNGCATIKPITVQQNINPPAAASIATPDELTCDVNSITLTGSSSTANVLYVWSGPDDFSDAAAVTNVTAPGNYTLTVINPSNGCSVSVPVTVIQDLSACR